MLRPKEQSIRGWNQRCPFASPGNVTLTKVENDWPLQVLSDPRGVSQLQRTRGTLAREVGKRVPRDGNGVDGTEFNREDGLRSFGQLLREGKIERADNGRFTASGQIGFQPGNRAAG